MRAITYFVCAFMLATVFTCAVLHAEEPQAKARASVPIYIAFHWHMHQPIYQPYENVCNSMAADSSIRDVFDQRVGAYSTWPADAIESGMNNGLEHLGASVSFSGSLIENLNNIESGGECYGHFSNWDARYYQARHWQTALGNPRLDFVGFGYYHPLMGLIDYNDTRKQIQAHKAIIQSTFGSDVSFSKGFFPPENAFSERMIPALVDEGFQWVLVDNIHFERACKGYPWASGGNLYEPNPSEQVNPDPQDWVQLTDVWAGTKISARWANQPHYAQYTDNTGRTSKMIVVPASRYLGNEDGRGGFGALQYEKVLSQLEPYNTDPAHPILVVLAHDGDNYGGGSDGYYHSNFNAFVDWCKANPSRFVPTTVQDYIDMFPPDANDVIHVEDGGWSGADNGDPEFKKWNGDPNGGYSPDRNSWGVVTAAKNWVFTAQEQAPGNANTDTAWKHLMNAETSCYWYWDGQSNWDSKPTMACNTAITAAQSAVNVANDATPPTIFLPQREPYNPGSKEWGTEQPKTFKVWTYVYDVSDLSSVILEYRINGGGWQSSAMTGTSIASQTTPQPTFKAKEYNASITCNELPTSCVEYRVVATDTKGKVAISPTQHVGGTSWWNPSPISFGSVSHGAVAAGSAVNVYATISSNAGSISSAVLHYFASGAAEQNSSMSYSASWLGTIPASALSMGATISYYVTAIDSAGNSARSQTISFVVPHPIRIFNITYGTPKEGQALEVKASIESTAGTIVSAQLNYSSCTPSCGAVSTLAMSASGGQYVGSIPGSAIGEGAVQFNIFASDSAGNKRESRAYSIAIGGAFCSTVIDGANDFPSGTQKHTGTGATSVDIVGVWLCNDADFLYVGVELGADVKANATQDFVAVYFEDPSTPNSTAMRYGGASSSPVRLEVGWWDKNAFYCEHTYSGSAWAWVKNLNTLAYGQSNKFLELKLPRIDDTHAGWSDGRSVGLYVATAREATTNNWVAGTITPRISYTFATNASTFIEEPVVPNNPPSINLISPANATKCSGMLVVNGTSFDTDGTIRYVNLTFSTTTMVLENEANWSFIINVSSLDNGSYPIDVIAMDDDGAIAFARVWIIVDKSVPPIEISSYCAINFPIENAKMKGVVEIRGNATILGNAKVYVKIENGAWNIANGTVSWRYIWNASAYPDGIYTVYAKASDGTIESNIAKVKIVISSSANNNTIAKPNEEFDPGVALALLFIAIAAIAAVVGLFVWRAKAMREKNEEKEDDRNANDADDVKNEEKKADEKENDEEE